MPSLKTLRICVAVIALAAGSGCDSAEERAEKHFQSAVELLEAGDPDRAVVELRNVLKLDDRHWGARSALAKIHVERGNTQGAIREYRIIAENQPDDIDAHVELALYAIEFSDWETARTYGDAARKIAPDNPKVVLIDTALGYFDAVSDLDASTRREIAKNAVALKADLGDHKVLSSIIIDNAIREGENDVALREIDEALSKTPDERNLQMMRLAILNQMEDVAGVEKQLLDMVESAPDDTAPKTMLVQFYVSQDQLDKAEAFLRGLFSPEDENPGDYVAFIRFLHETRGPEVSLEELDRAITVSPSPEVFEALRASLNFDEGKRDEAIATMEDLITRDDDPERIRAYKTSLARMLVTTGNEVGARRNVEEVLKEDPGNVEALKMSAVWMIQDDNAEEAIISLRSALEAAPEDTDIMRLIADAHTRNGNRELARDMLALAAETSNFAPTPTLRYANVLFEQDEYRASEEVLVRALRLAPEHVGLLNALGQVYVAEEDWARANQVEGTLRRLDTEQGTGVADNLRLAILRNQEKTDEAVSFLEGLVEENGQSLGALVAILQTHLSAGETDKAMEVVQKALEENPGNGTLLYLRAAALAADGRTEEALEGYRSLLETNRKNERLWMEVLRILNQTGNEEEASKYLDEALVELPEAPNLLWAKASVLEQEGDYDGAIDIYERLYGVSSDSPIIANNLASLITSYRDDEESLERAYVIARRLRGVEVPAFQDTYGWIAYRRGLYDEALQHLEPGAAGLPDDPMAQFHLGMTYAALNRPDEAIEALNRALSLAPDDPRPQFGEARKKIEELENAK